MATTFIQWTTFYNFINQGSKLEITRSYNSGVIDITWKTHFFKHFQKHSNSKADGFRRIMCVHIFTQKKIKCVIKYKRPFINLYTEIIFVYVQDSSISKCGRRILITTFINELPVFYYIGSMKYPVYPSWQNHGTFLTKICLVKKLYILDEFEGQVKYLIYRYIFRKLITKLSIL